MTKKFKKPPLVEVVWIDAVMYSDRDDIHGTLGHVLSKAKLWIRETAGYLIHQDGEDIPELMRRTLVAHDYDAPMEPGKEPEFGDVTVIPTGWVIKIRGVRNGSKSKAKTGGIKGGGLVFSGGVGTALGGDGTGSINVSSGPSGTDTSPAR